MREPVRGGWLCYLMHQCYLPSISKKTNTPESIHAHTHTCRAFSRTHAHAHAHTHARTHTHTYTLLLCASFPASWSQPDTPRYLNFQQPCKSERDSTRKRTRGRKEHTYTHQRACPAPMHVHTHTPSIIYSRIRACTHTHTKSPCESITASHPQISEL